MNKNDVIVFGLVAAMVIAVATAVTARYPAANVGSVADWFAAVGSIFAASTALYIAHHEARRARELLEDSRRDEAAREQRLSIERAQEARRTDALAVQTALGALTEGLTACHHTKKVMAAEPPESRRSTAAGLAVTSRFTSPTAVLSTIVPSSAHYPETALFLLNARSGWAVCVTRVEFVARHDLTDGQVSEAMGFHDVVDIYRKGRALLWKLRHNALDGEMPTEVAQAVEEDIAKNW